MSTPDVPLLSEREQLAAKLEDRARGGATTFYDDTPRVLVAVEDLLAAAAAIRPAPSGEVRERLENLAAHVGQALANVGTLQPGDYTPTVAEIAGGVRLAALAVNNLRRALSREAAPTEPDPNYLYAGKDIHRAAILCRNEEIDQLRAEVRQLKAAAPSEGTTLNAVRAILDSHDEPNAKLWQIDMLLNPEHPEGEEVEG